MIKTHQIGLSHLVDVRRKNPMYQPANQSQPLLDSKKVAANSLDVPYQSLIKVWSQEKLPRH